MKVRKRQVMLTAQKLFAEKGFTTTSVQDIIDKAQISKGTFYNYFSSKNECLIAILDNIHDETSLKRQEILAGQNITNKDILAKQISIRMKVNREHNIIPLFQAVHHSGDIDLKTAVNRYQLAELAWLTGRLVDVYGVEAVTVAPDCAVMMYGIIQHMIHTGTNLSKKNINATDLINFTRRRIDVIMDDMLATKDSFFEKDIFLDNHINKKVYTSQEILALMTEFNRSIENDSKASDDQFIQFMIDEIQSKTPRVSILEAVNRSFRETYTDSAHEHQAEELALNIWRYIDTLKNSL